LRFPSTTKVGITGQDWNPNLDRPITVEFACVALAIYALFGISTGIVLLVAGLTTGLLAFTKALDFVVSIYLSFSFFLLAMGILGAICAVWLWRLRKRGAVGGIVLLLVGMIVFTAFGLVDPTGFVLTFISIPIDIVNSIFTVILVASLRRWAPQE
jgi:uncharacterized membrane protein